MDPAKQRAAVRDTCTSFLQSRFGAYSRGHGLGSAAERTHMADIELDVWQELLVSARRQRNKARDACSLPPEILTSVFLFLKDDWEPQRLPDSGLVLSAGGGGVEIHPKYTLGWITILAVCYSWRQTALDSPSLWTRIPCLAIHPQYIPVMLARSRGLPLMLEAVGDVGFPDVKVPNVDISMPSAGIWLCRPVILRTQSLSMNALSDTHFTKWLSALQHPAPQLEDFRIIRTLQDGLDVASLPENLFDQHAPKLRLVYLQDIAFSWNTVLFTNTIVDLNIGFTEQALTRELPQTCTPTAQRFCEVISSMTSLKVLSLNEAFPLLTEDAYTHGILLPLGLEELFLGATAQFVTPCIDLFKRLTVPGHARVTINLAPYVDNGDIDNIHSIPAIMRRLFSPVETTAPVGLYLTRKSLYTHYVDRPPDDILLSKIPASCDEWEAFDDNPRTCGGRGLYISYPDDDSNQTILANVSSVPLTALQSLVCATDTYTFFTTPNTWIRHFASSCDVQNLSIPYDAALHLIEALYETALGANDTERVLLFPALKTLALHDAQEIEGPQDTLAERRETLNIVLVDMLHCRRQAGAPLDLLLVDEALSRRSVWGRVKELVRVDFFSLAE